MKSSLRPINFIEYDLANGMHVILHEDHAAPLATISVWYHVGSRDEEPGRTGFAHLFEHVMFQGSENVKKQEHFKYIQDVGGSMNASTAPDRTNYFQTVPSQYLPLALWLESDRMRSLAVTQENFENQRDVVKEERRQRYDNVPYGTLFERVLDKVFVTCGYHWAPIGSMDDLDNAQIEDVRAFHAKFYVPNNATLVIAGDFEQAAAREWIETYFADIPRGAEIVHTPVNEPPIAGPMRVTTTEQVPQALVALVFHAPGDVDPDAMSARFLGEILSGGESAPLYKRLVYDLQIASHVNFHPVLFEAAGLYFVEAMVAPGVDPAHVEEVIWEELERARTTPPTEREIERARNGMLKYLVESRSTVFHRSQLLSQARVYFGDTNRVNEEWKEAEAVSAADIHRLAQVFLPQHAAVFTIIPSGPA